MTTLDPRALEAAAEAVGRHIHYSRQSHNCHRCRRTAESAITAYLAVTRPVVETVRELEGLPAGTVIQTVDEGETEVWITDGAGGQEWSLAGSCQRFSAALMPLPARVIWRPHASA